MQLFKMKVSSVKSNISLYAAVYKRLSSFCDLDIRGLRYFFKISNSNFGSLLLSQEAQMAPLA